jgi:hypothetical protein
MTEKIQPQHLERKAILCVRQSSAYESESQPREPKITVRHGGTSPASCRLSDVLERT